MSTINENNNRRNMKNCVALDAWDEYNMMVALKDNEMYPVLSTMDIIKKHMTHHQGRWCCRNEISTYELLQLIQKHKHLDKDWLQNCYQKIVSHKKTKLFGTYSTRTPTLSCTPSMSNTQLKNFLTLIPE
tara:strand:- start:309 stop:698 length:390 start_codon:yes stop_codon:yes gene_type:complete